MLIDLIFGGVPLLILVALTWFVGPKLGHFKWSVPWAGIGAGVVFLLWQVGAPEAIADSMWVFVVPQILIALGIALGQRGKAPSPKFLLDVLAISILFVLYVVFLRVSYILQGVDDGTGMSGVAYVILYVFLLPVGVVVGLLVAWVVAKIRGR